MTIEPRRRFHVFVSSTYQDLRHERQEILQVLLRMGCIPLGMELFPNGHESLWDLIRQTIDECDFYLLIVAGRYGSVSHSGLSYTEEEYRYAVKGKKPILSFLHARPASRGKGGNETEADRREKLVAFRTELEGRGASYWVSREELGREVALALSKALGESDGGWIEAKLGARNLLARELDALTSRLSSSEIQEKLKKLESLLEGFRSTEGRVLSLGELLPWLSPEEWEQLSVLGRTMASIQVLPASEGERSKSVGRALESARRQVIGHYTDICRGLQYGIVEVAGESLYAISGFFTQEVRDSFLAMSHNDLAFWKSEESSAYYRQNVELVRRGIHVERTFVVRVDQARTPTLRDVIRRQLADGIKVRLVSEEVVEAIVTGNQSSDFGLMDDFAISFFRSSLIRVYRVETSREKCYAYRTLYERISQYCEPVPEKDRDDDRLFETLDEFDKWWPGFPYIQAPNTGPQADG